MLVELLDGQLGRFAVLGYSLEVQLPERDGPLVHT